MKVARIDANQPAIVQAFRKLGASVLHLHSVGGGCPGIAVSLRGKTAMVEIKDGSKPPSARKLTPMEEKFFATWQGDKAVIASVDEAIAFVMEWGRE